MLMDLRLNKHTGGDRVGGDQEDVALAEDKSSGEEMGRAVTRGCGQCRNE